MLYTMFCYYPFSGEDFSDPFHFHIELDWWQYIFWDCVYLQWLSFKSLYSSRTSVMILLLLRCSLLSYHLLLPKSSTFFKDLQLYFSFVLFINSFQSITPPITLLFVGVYTLFFFLPSQKIKMLWIFVLFYLIKVKYINVVEIKLFFLPLQSRC